MSVPLTLPPAPQATQASAAAAPEGATQHDATGLDGSGAAEPASRAVFELALLQARRILDTNATIEGSSPEPAGDAPGAAPFDASELDLVVDGEAAVSETLNTDAPTGSQLPQPATLVDLTATPTLDVTAQAETNTRALEAAAEPRVTTDGLERRAELAQAEAAPETPTRNAVPATNTTPVADTPSSGHDLARDGSGDLAGGRDDAANSQDPRAGATAQPSLENLQAARVAPDIEPGVARPEAAVSAEPTGTRATSAEQELRALPELPARAEHEIVREARLLARQGGGVARIRLNPPQLGELSIRVSVNEQVVNISLLSDRLPVAELLGRHGAELRQALEGQGLRVDRLDVDADRADDASDAGFRSAEERQASRERTDTQRVDGFLSNGAPLLPRTDVHTLGAVDVRV